MVHTSRLVLVILMIAIVSSTLISQQLLGVLQVYASSPYEQQSDDNQQDEPADDQPTDDEQVDEPVPADPIGGPETTLEPVTEPLEDADPNDLDDGDLIEREKECPKGEYDNGGKCAKIPQCTPPETWSAMEKKCRIFPWWLVMR